MFYEYLSLEMIGQQSQELQGCGMFALLRLCKRYQVLSIPENVSIPFSWHLLPYMSINHVYRCWYSEAGCYTDQLAAPNWYSRVCNWDYAGRGRTCDVVCNDGYYDFGYGGFGYDVVSSVCFFLCIQAFFLIFSVFLPLDPIVLPLDSLILQVCGSDGKFTAVRQVSGRDAVPKCGKHEVKAIMGIYSC